VISENTTIYYGADRARVYRECSLRPDRVIILLRTLRDANRVLFVFFPSDDFQNVSKSTDIKYLHAFGTTITTLRRSANVCYVCLYRFVLNAAAAACPIKRNSIFTDVYDIIRAFSLSFIYTVRTWGRHKRTSTSTLTMGL